MPELPEVEVIKIALQNLCQQTIVDVIIRQKQLRYPIANNLANKLIQKTISAIMRSAKYLIIQLHTNDCLIIHLGMSGNLLILPNDTTNLHNLGKHDHADIVLSDYILRYNDPRRFGAIIYHNNFNNLNQHSLFKHLGVEPLTKKFNANYLYNQLKQRKTTIKQLLMDNKVVVGVGNIYACEALFMAKISPLKPANNLTLANSKTLVASIKSILQKAINQGGSSIRDYKQLDGNYGYFQNQHQVYGRAEQKCNCCNSKIIATRLGVRNTFYCPQCQI